MSCVYDGQLNSIWPGMSPNNLHHPRQDLNLQMSPWLDFGFSFEPRSRKDRKSFEKQTRLLPKKRPALRRQRRTLSTGRAMQREGWARLHPPLKTGKRDGKTAGRKHRRRKEKAKQHVRHQSLVGRVQSSVILPQLRGRSYTASARRSKSAAERSV